MFDPVEEPVQFCSPPTTVGVIEHTLEVSQGFLVCFLHCESFSEVTDVVNALQLRDSWNPKYKKLLSLLKTGDQPVGNIIVKRVMRRLACFLRAM